VIFATVGSQESFDRLIRAVDEWAILRGRDDVFAQIGGSTLQPKHIKFTKFLEPNEFNRVIREASVIVAHAGMGWNKLQSLFYFGAEYVPTRDLHSRPWRSTLSSLRPVASACAEGTSA